MSDAPPEQLLDTIRNLAHFHREHEKFYARAPLRTAFELQTASRALQALADHWQGVEPAAPSGGNPYAGAEDLNPPGLAADSGILFLEGEGEPAEIARMKRDLATVAADLGETGDWLERAMEQSWKLVGGLAAYPELADVLGERHRIVANDWQSAGLQGLAARLIRRALELLDAIEIDPASLRRDLAGPRVTPAYLLAGSELIDRAADLLAASAQLVHDNERRWRIFESRVRELAPGL